MPSALFRTLASASWPFPYYGSESILGCVALMELHRSGSSTILWMKYAEAVVYSLILLVTLGVLFSAIVFRDPPRL